MKLLIAIQNCFNVGDNSLIFFYAWRSFVEKNGASLDCDFVFMNNGLDATRFESLCQPHKSCTLPSSRVVWDTDFSYWPFHTYHSQYDFILRVDNDAFLTVENINTIIDFLKENEDIDFVSASNFCRPITNQQDNRQFVLDTSSCELADIPKWEWKPWCYPTHNSDLYIIKSAFFREALQAYADCPYTRNDLSLPYTPFDTANMNYSQMCAVLQFTETRFPQEYLGLRLRIDGSINSDFWTVMCSLKPRMAGIVNYDGRSFRFKNHLVTFSDALNQGVAFKDVVDTIDIAFIHEKNIVAPYFHVGNAYVSNCFFDINHSHLNHVNTIGQFQHGANTFAVLHYCMVLLFCTSAEDKTMLNRLNATMEPWFVKHGIDKKKIMGHYTDLVSFLRPTLKEYLNEGNIDTD